MQENRDEVTLVVYDYDHCLTMQHTHGLDQAHDYEHPYPAILRARQHLKQHCQRLIDSGKAVLSIGTFGEFQPRIDAACEYLGTEDNPLLSHCEFVNKRKKFTQGKNNHIYEILKSYYQKHPNGPRVKQVYLLDDDCDNIFATGGYATYLTETLGISDERYMVKVRGFQVTVPRLEKITTFVDKKMVDCFVTTHDEEFDTDIFVETRTTQSMFIKTLESLEKALLSENTDTLVYNAGNPLTFFENLSSSSDSISELSIEDNPLTTSCGAEERLLQDDDEQKPDSLRSSANNITV